MHCSVTYLGKSASTLPEGDGSASETNCRTIIPGQLTMATGGPATEAKSLPFGSQRVFQRLPSLTILDSKTYEDRCWKVCLFGLSTGRQVILL